MSLKQMLHCSAQVIANSITRVFTPFSTKVVRNISPELNNLDYSKPTILAANHQNSLDPFMVASYMPMKYLRRLYPWCFMTANVYYFSTARPFAYLLGCFPAKENNRGVDYGIEGAVKKIKNGDTLCIFPEGRRTRPGETEARPGVKVIIDRLEDCNLILVHLDWHKGKGRRKQLDLTYSLAKKEPVSAQAILDEIYKL